MRSFLDPYFAVPEKPPFPFGRSPFRQRGSLYLSNFEFWERVVPGGVEAMRKRIADENLDRFLMQKFTPGGYYDALPSAFLHIAAARVRGVSVYQQLREHGELLAERMFQGFSGVLLRVLSTEMVATWLPRISASYHEFGGVETKVTAPRVVRGVRSGMPRMFMQPWALTSTEIIEKSLAWSGARSPRVHVLEPEPEPAVSGYEVFRVPFEVRWEE